VRKRLGGHRSRRTQRPAKRIVKHRGGVAEGGGGKSGNRDAESEKAGQTGGAAGDAYFGKSSLWIGSLAGNTEGFLPSPFGRSRPYAEGPERASRRSLGDGSTTQKKSARTESPSVESAGWLGGPDLNSPPPTHQSVTNESPKRNAYRQHYYHLHDHNLEEGAEIFLNSLLKTKFTIL